MPKIHGVLLKTENHYWGAAKFRDSDGSYAVATYPDKGQQGHEIDLGGPSETESAPPPDPTVRNGGSSSDTIAEIWIRQPDWRRYGAAPEDMARAEDMLVVPWVGGRDGPTIPGELCLPTRRLAFPMPVPPKTDFGLRVYAPEHALGQILRLGIVTFRSCRTY